MVEEVSCQAFGFDGVPLHPKGHHAAMCSGCNPPVGFEQQRIMKLECVAGFHAQCGPIQALVLHFLQRGKMLMGSVDGCAKQHKCANSVWFMSMPVSSHTIVMERSIGASGLLKVDC